MDLPNPNRINVDDPAEVMLWADMLSISVERLTEIVGKVGPMSAAVRFYASRSEEGAKGKASKPVSLKELIG